jgi:hypothetical protein
LHTVAGVVKRRAAEGLDLVRFSVRRRNLPDKQSIHKSLLPSSRADSQSPHSGRRQTRDEVRGQPLYYGTLHAIDLRNTKPYG